MLRNIRNFKTGDTKAFTIVEIMLASVIAAFILTTVMGVYMMCSQWWAEIGPRLDAEKCARMALLSIIEGSVDSTAGSYTVDGTIYTRRNGIAWATATPLISGTGDSDISYRLVPDDSNSRHFYKEIYNGDGYIYYVDGIGPVKIITSTKGVTDLRFSTVEGHDNIIQVEVTAEKDVYGTRRADPYTISVTYTDTVYLRNTV